MDLPTTISDFEEVFDKQYHGRLSQLQFVFLERIFTEALPKWTPSVSPGMFSPKAKNEILGSEAKGGIQAISYKSYEEIKRTTQPLKAV